ncbi:MAG TPA: hypothetical protein VLF61_03860 [Rhabdochlamydiaceae bacterium]|nr:hypothetical protein [Rhabdochlamydiaceae bacterium]
MLLLDVRQRRREDQAPPSAPVPILGAKVRGITAVTSDLTGEVYGGFSLTEALQVHYKAPGLQILNWPSRFFSLGTGATSAVEGYRKAEWSQKVKDLKGRALGWLQCGRGVLNSLGSGGCLIPATCIDFALFFTTSKTALFAATILTGTGESFLAAASILYGFSALIFITHGLSFRRQLSQAGSECKALEILQGMRDEDLLYAMGAAGLEAVKTGSLERAKEVLEIVFTENSKQILISLLYLAICLCATGLTILSIIFTEGPVLFGLAFADTALGLVCLIMDLVALFSSFDEDRPGKYDRLWMSFLFVFCSLIFIASALLSHSLVPLLVSTCLGVLLFLMLLAYKKTAK